MKKWLCALTAAMTVAALAVSAFAEGIVPRYVAPTVTDEMFTALGESDLSALMGNGTARALFALTMPLDIRDDFDSDAQAEAAFAFSSGMANGPYIGANAESSCIIGAYFAAGKVLYAIYSTDTSEMAFYIVEHDCGDDVLAAAAQSSLQTLTDAYYAVPYADIQSVAAALAD